LRGLLLHHARPVLTNLSSNQSRDNQEKRSRGYPRPSKTPPAAGIGSNLVRPRFQVGAHSLERFHGLQTLLTLQDVGFKVILSCCVKPALQVLFGQFAASDFVTIHSSP